MGQADGVAVNRLVRLEFKATVQLHIAVGVGAITFCVEHQLAAFGIDELAVAQAVVMLVVLAWREQAAEAQLLAHRGLGVTGGSQQRLRAATVVFVQAHAGGEWLAAGLDLHVRAAIGGARWRYLCLQCHTRDTPHQRGVALEGLAGQRAFTQQLGRQLVDVGRD